MYSQDIYDILEQFGEYGTTNNLLSYALGILMIVARWFIFAKAGEEGWASIIPFYNKYVLYKVSDKKKLFLPWLLCGIACYVALIGMVIALVFALAGEFGIDNYNAWDGYGALVICAIIMLGTAIAIFVFNIFQNIGLAKQFNLDGGWAVGLIFLPHIFYSIIAFSKKYQHVNGQAKNPTEPFAQPYGQMPYGQAPYGQAPYGQSPYENPYAQPQQPMYGQPETPAYGQPQAPAYGDVPPLPPTMDYGQTATTTTVDTTSTGDYSAPSGDYSAPTNSTDDNQ